jgi:hypothetical protein
MRTQSRTKVKHSHAFRTAIDHCSRELCNAFCMPDERESALDGQLPDGRYDAFILSAESRADAVALSCTITTGPHRGDVIDIVSTQFATRDPIALMGLPCTLVVRGDEIRIEA